MTFDRFNDERQIGDLDDGPEYKNCIQCGESFETNCFAEIDEEFCSDECTMMYSGVEIETEID